MWKHCSGWCCTSVRDERWRTVVHPQLHMLLIACLFLLAPYIRISSIHIILACIMLEQMLACQWISTVHSPYGFNYVGLFLHSLKYNWLINYQYENSKSNANKALGLFSETQMVKFVAFCYGILVYINLCVDLRVLLFLVSRAVTFLYLMVKMLVLLWTHSETRISVITP